VAEPSSIFTARNAKCAKIPWGLPGTLGSCAKLEHKPPMIPRGRLPGLDSWAAQAPVGRQNQPAMRGFLKLSSPIVVLAPQLAVSFPLAWLRGGDGAGCHFSARAHANPTRSILSGPCEELQKALPP
jgi:hypothetical protein